MKKQRDNLIDILESHTSRDYLVRAVYMLLWSMQESDDCPQFASYKNVGMAVCSNRIEFIDIYKDASLGSLVFEGGKSHGKRD